MSHEYLRAIAGSGLGDGVTTFGRVGLAGGLVLVRLHGADGPVQIAHDHSGTPRTEGEVLLVAPTREGSGVTGYRVVDPRAVGVGSQSVLGINGYVYGPYGRQDVEDGVGMRGLYQNAFPSPLTLLGQFIPDPSVYAWGRVTATVYVTHEPRPDHPDDLPIIATALYQVFNSDSPGGSALFTAAGALAPVGGSAYSPGLDANDVAAGNWFRADGMGTGSLSLPWMSPPAPGTVRIVLYGQVQHFGRYDILFSYHKHVRKGRFLGQSGEVVRANAFLSIPGYPP